MKLFFYSLFIGLISTTCIVGQTTDELYEKSSQLFDNNEYKKALTTINKAIKEAPDQSKLYQLKGNILYMLNEDINEFFSYLSKGVEVEPDSPFPLINRGGYYEQIGQYPNAILDYKDALKITDVDSIKITIYTNLGAAYQKIQKLEVAHDQLMKGYEIDSNDIGILNNLAMCLDNLNQRDEARVYLHRIIAIDSTLIYPYVNLGFQASLNEEFQLALKYLNKANELDPDEPLTLNNRGYVKLKLEDVRGALKDINRSIELRPDNSYAYRNKALIFIEKEESEKICENLYLAKQLGFANYYGEEVNELIKKHCIK